MEDIRRHGHVLTPGRYVGAAPQRRRRRALRRRRWPVSLPNGAEQQAEAHRLDAEP